MLSHDWEYWFCNSCKRAIRALFFPDTSTQFQFKVTGVYKMFYNIIKHEHKFAHTIMHSLTINQKIISMIEHITKIDQMSSITTVSLAVHCVNTQGFN